MGLVSPVSLVYLLGMVSLLGLVGLFGVGCQVGLILGIFLLFDLIQSYFEIKVLFLKSPKPLMV